MAQGPESQSDIRKEGSAESRESKKLPPDFDERYREVEDLIERGEKTFSSLNTEPDIHFLLARNGRLLYRAIEKGAIMVDKEFIDKAIWYARNETIFGGAMKSVLFSHNFEMHADGQITEASHESPSMIVQKGVLNYFQEMRNASSRMNFFQEFRGPFAKELMMLMPPTPSEVNMLRIHNPQTLFQVLNGPCRDVFFEMAFPQAPDGGQCPEIKEFIREPAYVREVLEGATGEKFMERAFPTPEHFQEWIKANPSIFFQLLGAPIGEKFFSFATAAGVQSTHMVKEEIWQQTRKLSGFFFKHLNSPLGEVMWEIAKPTSENIKKWIELEAPSFVEALNGPLGKRIMERANFSQQDISAWKDIRPDLFIQSLKTPFGDELLRAAFAGSDHQNNLAWVSKNYHQFFYEALRGPKAIELLSVLNPTPDEMEQLARRDMTSFSFALQELAGERLFSLISPELRSEIVTNFGVPFLFSLKLSKELHNKNGIFERFHEAQKNLEQKRSQPLDPDERTNGIEIEPFNSERSELRTKAFSVRKDDERRAFFSAFADASKAWAERENEENIYSNTHLNIGMLKRDTDIISEHRKLFFHHVPESYLYAYFPIERIIWRGIGKLMNSTLDIDIERSLNPHVIARLQYRIGCVGGEEPERDIAIKGIEQILDTTLRILDSVEMRDAYESLFRTPEFHDRILEVDWLIRDRYMPAQERASKLMERVQALKKLAQGLGDNAPTDEMKKEKTALVREMKLVKSEIDHWPGLIKERQAVLRKVLENVKEAS